MVILYDQNLNIIIHCKKLQKQLEFISSYVDTPINSHNNLNIKTIVEIYTSLFYWKLNQNYSKFHVLLKMKSKQQIKFVVYLKQNLWFSTTKYL
jgi:hypothetical protein